MKKLNIKMIAEMSDEEVYKLSMIRPNYQLDKGGCRGFMFPLQAFENKEEMSVCMFLLIQRLSKINR